MRHALKISIRKYYMYDQNERSHKKKHNMRASWHMKNWIPQVHKENPVPVHITVCRLAKLPHICNRFMIPRETRNENFPELKHSHLWRPSSITVANNYSKLDLIIRTAQLNTEEKRNFEHQTYSWPHLSISHAAFLIYELPTLKNLSKRKTSAPSRCDH